MLKFYKLRNIVVHAAPSVGEHQKFCHECGQSLHNKCTACDAPLKQDAKFCPDCGKAVVDDEA
ncbi:zinc-ribbon domain-containing protein [Erysipelothrix sp. D19-032]